MHNFLVHSNERWCRKRWRLGLDQFLSHLNLQLLHEKKCPYQNNIFTYVCRYMCMDYFRRWMISHENIFIYILNGRKMTSSQKSFSILRLNEIGVYYSHCQSHVYFSVQLFHIFLIFHGILNGVMFTYFIY